MNRSVVVAVDSTYEPRKPSAGSSRAARCRPKIGDFRDHGRSKIFRATRFAHCVHYSVLARQRHAGCRHCRQLVSWRCRRHASGTRDRRSLAVVGARRRLPAGAAGSLAACVAGSALLSRARGAGRRERRASRSGRSALPTASCRGGKAVMRASSSQPAKPPTVPGGLKGRAAVDLSRARTPQRSEERGSKDATCPSSLREIGDFPLAAGIHRILATSRESVALSRTTASPGTVECCEGFRGCRGSFHVRLR